MTMNEENNMEKEVKELLGTLKEYGRDKRQKQQISDLIDGLAAKETHRKIVPLWLKTAIGVAACALLFFVLKIAKHPAETETQEMAQSVSPQSEEIVLDSVVMQEENFVENVENQVVERFVVEKKVVVAQNAVNKPKSKNDVVAKQEMVENIINHGFVQKDSLLIAQSEPVFNDTVQIVDVQVEPSPRRVIRAENLVTYSNPVRKHLNKRGKSGSKEKGVIGLPQYSASEGCMLAFEINTDLHD